MRCAAGLIAAGMGLFQIAIIIFLLRVCCRPFLLPSGPLLFSAICVSFHLCLVPLVLTPSIGIMAGQPWFAAAAL